MARKHIIIGVTVLSVLTAFFLYLLVGPKVQNSNEASPPADTSSNNSLPSLQLTYEVNASVAELYNIVVSAQESKAQIVQIAGQACNNMSGSVDILPKGSSTDKQVIKTLDDGRLVLEPVTISTLKACEGGGPELDDQLLNDEILNVTKSLQSY
jgi:hypothetical protein